MKPVKTIDKKAVSALKQFTDREEPRETFRRAFTYGREHPDEFNVISYYGIGGFGKSRLIHELMSSLSCRNERVSELQRTVYTLYDFEEGTGRLSCLTHMKNKLKKQGLEFPLFEAAEIAFNEKSGIPMYQNVQENTLLNNPILAVTAEFIPGAKNVLEIMRSGKDALGEIGKYFRRLKKYWNVDEQELTKEIGYISTLEAKNIEEQLPYYFAKDLSRNVEHAADLGFALPIVLFLDTYELLVNSYKNHEYSGVYDEWLRNDIVKAVPGILYVIGGREKLNWGAKDSFFEEMEEHELGDLSRNDSFDFLRAAGVKEELLEDIFHITGGTPLFLDLSVNTYYETLAEGKECTKEDFGINKESLIERFFRYMEAEDRKIAIVLALLQRWNDEEYKQIGPRILEGQYDFERYAAFNEHTIILKDAETRYYMHESVREVLRRVSLQPKYLQLREKTILVLQDYFIDLLLKEGRSLQDVSTDLREITNLLNEKIPAESVRKLWEASKETVDSLSDKGQTNLLLQYLNGYLRYKYEELEDVYCEALLKKARILAKIGREDLSLEYIEELKQKAEGKETLREPYQDALFLEVDLVMTRNELERVSEILKTLQASIPENDYYNLFRLAYQKANLAMQIGDYEEAIRCNHLALDYIDQGDLSLSTLSDVYNNLGVALFSNGNVEGGEEYINKGYEIAKEYWGETHYNALSHLIHVIGIMIFQGKLDTVEDLLDEAEPVIQKNYGEYSSLYRELLIMRAGYLIALSRDDEACDLLEYVGKLQERLPYLDYRVESVRLDYIYQAAADLMNDEMMLWALEEKENFIIKKFGEHDKELITVYEYFQEYYYDKKDYEAVLRYGEKAEEVQLHLPAQKEIHYVRFQSGRAYNFLNQPKKAVPLLEDAYRNYTEAAIFINKKRVGIEYLFALIESGEYQTYTEVFDEMMKDGYNPSYVAKIDYAYALTSCKRTKEAVAEYEEIRAHFKRIQQTEEKRCYMVLWNLASCYADLKEMEKRTEVFLEMNPDLAKQYLLPGNFGIYVSDMARYYQSQKNYGEALYFMEYLKEFYEERGMQKNLDALVKQMDNIRSTMN